MKGNWTLFLIGVLVGWLVIPTLLSVVGKGMGGNKK